MALLVAWVFLRSDRLLPERGFGASPLDVVRAGAVLLGSALLLFHYVGKRALAVADVAHRGRGARRSRTRCSKRSPARAASRTSALPTSRCALLDTDKAWREALRLFGTAEPE
jgi:hypothetical protein